MIRRERPPSVEQVPQWQTIYCSLVLLLVVFFILLLAYSAIDRDRFRKVKKMAQAARAAPVEPQEIGQAMAALERLAAQAGMGEGLTLVRTAEGFKAVVPNPVLFPSGQAFLNESGYAMLDGIVAVAQRNDLAIQVEGHTDDVPIETAQFPSNWELSTMRAVNILRYFQNKGDIPSRRLAAVGFAEYRPVAGNDTPAGRQKNRRIEILFRPAL